MTNKWRHHYKPSWHNRTCLVVWFRHPSKGATRSLRWPSNYIQNWSISWKLKKSFSTHIIYWFRKKKEIKTNSEDKLTSTTLKKEWPSIYKATTHRFVQFPSSLLYRQLYFRLQLLKRHVIVLMPAWSPHPIHHFKIPLQVSPRSPMIPQGSQIFLSLEFNPW